MWVSCIKIIAPISGHPRTLICGYDWASMEFVYACVARFKMGLGGLNYFFFLVKASLSRDRLVGFVTYPPCMVVLPTSCIANILFTNVWSHFTNMLGQSPHFFCLISGSKTSIYMNITLFCVMAKEWGMCSKNKDISQWNDGKTTHWLVHWIKISYEQVHNLFPNCVKTAWRLHKEKQC